MTRNSSKPDSAQPSRAAGVAAIVVYLTIVTGLLSLVCAFSAGWGATGAIAAALAFGLLANALLRQ